VLMDPRDVGSLDILCGHDFVVEGQPLRCPGA
jgi:hypothetical protein